MLKYLRALFVIFWVAIFIYPWVYACLLFPRLFSKKTKFRIAKIVIYGCDIGLAVKYKVINRERINTPGPVVFYGNHQSMYDILSMISRTKKPMSALAKKETRRIIMVGNISKMIGCTYLDREDLRSQIKTINETTRLVKEGSRFFVFPEGKRSVTKEIDEFKPGSFKIATNSQATIVPFAIDGADTALNSKVKMRKTKVKIIFGDPVPYENYQDLSAIDLAQQVQVTVQELYNKLKEVNF